MLVFLFVSSLFCGCAYTVSECLEFVYSSATILFFQYESFGCFFQILLATLIIRLYITFQGTVYRMSSILIFVFSVIMLLGSVGWLVFSALIIYTELDHDKLYFVAYSVAFLYVIGSVLAVYFFVSNLTEIAKLRERSTKDLNIEPKDIALDIHQQRLSDLSAKYMMLFALAILSTILLNILALFVNNESGLRSSFWSCDLVVNVCLMYLQFCFAKKRYNQCCRCCDRKCRNFMAGRTKTAIHKYSLIKMQNHAKESTSGVSLCTV